MKKTGFQILLLMLVLIVVMSCGNPGVFDQYKTIPANGWNKDSLLVFDVPISSTVQKHNLYISVRNDISYKYSNLWLFVEIVQPGNISHTDTFEITLADPAGKWLGDGFGGIKTREMVFKRNVYFPNSGIYQINIRHGMRNNVLHGITDVGFRVDAQKN